MFKKVLIASAMLVSAISANAADNASFGVAGGVTPGPCDISLSNASTADFGIQTSAHMKTLGVYNNLYSVGTKTIGFSVVCGAATKAEISFSDNKPGKNFPMNAEDWFRFGVTDGAGSTSIGNYQISLDNLLLDGGGVTSILGAVTGTTTWGLGYANYVAPGHSYGFTKTAGAIVPEAFTTLSGNLTIALMISKAYADSATNAVSFSSGGVITIQYL